MNQTQLQQTIVKLLPEVLENAEKNRRMNDEVPISGIRYTLPLEGRDIAIAYYTCETPNAPLVVGLHGGGFLFGGSALDDDLWLHVVQELNVNVASVNYRQSPQVMDFDPLYDAYDSICYLKEHAEQFGFDPAHISVFGSSAGGNLAAAVCILAKQRGGFVLDNQILMYPFLDGATDPDSKGEGSFSGVFPYIMNKLHFSPELAQDPLLSPVFAQPQLLEGLPKAIVAYCEMDNLRAEAQQYCEKLKEAGVPVAEYFAAQMPHGYIENGFKKMFGPHDLEFLGPNAREIVDSGLLRRTSDETLQFIAREMI